MSSHIEISPDILQPLVGAEVLNLLGEEQRNQLLCHAVHEAFNAWSVKKSVEAVVAAAVRERVAAMLLEIEWQKRFQVSVDEAIADVIAKLPGRVAAAMSR